MYRCGLTAFSRWQCTFSWFAISCVSLSRALGFAVACRRSLGVPCKLAMGTLTTFGVAGAELKVAAAFFVRSGVIGLAGRCGAVRSGVGDRCVTPAHWTDAASVSSCTFAGVAAFAVVAVDRMRRLGGET